MQVLKSKRLSLILTSMALLIVGGLSAQHQLGVQAPPFKTPVFVSSTYKLLLAAPDLELDKAPIHMRTPYHSPHWRPMPFNSPLANDVLTTLALFNNFNHNNMPFFCKVEFQMEQAARFPVKFRLGDINYVDRLEQKVDWELGN